MTDLKEECVQNSKRKKSEVDNYEEPISKQPKIGDVIAPPYGPEHPGPQCRSLKVATIEKKVIVGSAILKNGFIFNVKDAKVANESSSDDGNSF